MIVSTELKQKITATQESFKVSPVGFSRFGSRLETADWTPPSFPSIFLCTKFRRFLRGKLHYPYGVCTAICPIGADKKL
ncbi:MAG: hypothetical protein LBB43_05080 [Spirochaetaceae bacterium]|jgi:hypothetical protein|nr:hypothetical protein [Spirochaetaceae bacterium]